MITTLESAWSQQFARNKARYNKSFSQLAYFRKRHNYLDSYVVGWMKKVKDWDSRQCRNPFS